MTYFLGLDVSNRRVQRRFTRYSLRMIIHGLSRLRRLFFAEQIAAMHVDHFQCFTAAACYAS